MVKALVFDFDETLSHPGAVFTERVRNGLRAIVKANDLKLFIVSGRPLKFLQDMMLGVGVDGFIAENGNVVFTSGEGKRVLNPGGEAITRVLRKSKNRAYEIKETIAELPREYMGDAIMSLDAAGVRYITEVNKKGVMILPPGTSKVNGLKHLLREFDLDFSDVLAAGDGENDREMLEKCAMSVCPSNAADELKKVADFITDGEYGTGLIKFLERLYAQKNSIRV